MKFAVVILALVSAACNPGPPLSPLIGAAREGNVPRINELVKMGANVNERGGVNDWTPLMHAVHKNQAGSVRALIDAGADINATGGALGRDTALRLAEVQGETEIANMLRAAATKTTAKTAQ